MRDNPKGKWAASILFIGWAVFIVFMGLAILWEVVSPTMIDVIHAFQGR